MKKISILILLILFMTQSTSFAFSWKNIFKKQSKKPVISTLHIEKSPYDTTAKELFVSLMYKTSSFNEATKIIEDLEKDNADVFNIINNYTLELIKNREKVSYIIDSLPRAEQILLVMEGAQFNDIGKKYEKDIKQAIKAQIVLHAADEIRNCAKLAGLNF